MKPLINQFKACLLLATFAIAATFIISCKKDQTEKTIKPNDLQAAMLSSAAASLPAASSTVSEGLIAYWTCANTTYDMSGNNNTATLFLVNAAADRLGHANGAYHFNGINSYMTVMDTAALRLSNTDFSVTAWIKLYSHNTSFGDEILSKHLTGNDQGWAWSVTGDAAGRHSLFFGPGGTNNDAFGKDTINLNRWHLVTTTYKVANHAIRHYIDGVLDTIIQNIAPPNAMITAELCIGRDNPEASANGYFFNGVMGDIRIYNRALLQKDIRVLQLATTAPTAGLLGYWPLANTNKDLSGNSNNGTNHNVNTTKDRFGNPIGAYHFNGTNSYISIPDKMALRLNNTDFAINAWIKLYSHNSSYGNEILSKHLTGNDQGWAWSVTGSAEPRHSLFFGPGGTNNDAFGTDTVDLNRWHMVTVMYSLSNQSITFYIDGVLDVVIPNIASPNAAIAAEMCIGRDNPEASANGYFFNGVISDVRMYNRALSSTELNQLLNALN